MNQLTVETYVIFTYILKRELAYTYKLIFGSLHYRIPWFQKWPSSTYRK